MKPLVGISCCTIKWGTFGATRHTASDNYVRVVDLVIGGLPLLIPANGDTCDVDAIVGLMDAIILTGSPSNVEPRHYLGTPHPETTPEDHARDATTLRLIRAAIAAGTPLLAICRGMQELNVALGGSLTQRIQDLPDRLDHSTPMQPFTRVRQGKAHQVSIIPGSWLAQTVGATNIPVNSLHNQGVDRLAPRLVAEAHAPDGTIEAVRVADAPGFAVGVQWHPEYDFEHDAASHAIFMAFTAAIQARRSGRRAA